MTVSRSGLAGVASGSAIPAFYAAIQSETASQGIVVGTMRYARVSSPPLHGMVISRNKSTEVRPLAHLGIGEVEERIYRWLLTHRGAKASETARALALAPGKAQRLLDALEGKGLATHTPERPRRYIPSSPDVALEALIAQR